MLRRLLFAGMLLLSVLARAQAGPATYHQRLSILENAVRNARTDPEKVAALGALAVHYYIYKATAKGDSVLQHQLTLAEESTHRDLMLRVLFSYSTDNINSWNSVSTFDKALSFLDKGLAYARNSRQYDYQALAHIRKAAILRNRNRYDAALEQTAQAQLALDKQPDDSIRSVLLLEMGDIFGARGNALTAYEHYNRAYDLAYIRKNYPLQTKAYHHIALLYNSLGRADLAENMLHTSLEGNRGRSDLRGMLYDYVDLARVVEKKEYIQRALTLADSLGSERDRMFAHQLMFAYLMVVQKDSRAALRYLQEQPDFYQLQQNRGPAQYAWQIGSIYFYAGQPDSAIRHFTAAEPQLRQMLDAPGLIDLDQNVGDCYQQLGMAQKALPYYTEAAELAARSGNLLTQRNILLKLSRAHAALGHFAEAHRFTEEYLAYQDSAGRVNSGRELALLEVERANSQHQHDLAELQRQQEREKYLQYNIISLAIVMLFLFLIVAGMFPISPFTTRLLGYISFICLFEFLILLIDTSLHHAVHGKPLYIWLVKIVIIALLVPVHHFLEKKVVRFVQSKKLNQLRARLTGYKGRGVTKKAGKPLAAGLPADTDAV
ncbi:MAG TPA: tetratricopeptide repeat protein [Chitinophagaceae bacterium]|jgi:tetratricopeptide (TPR) repeat protein|nr:tetratricopeptide repeat protein [Chitinophagaceae bacterium]